MDTERTRLEPGDFAYISTFVREQSAIVIEPGKEYLVSSRLMPIVRAQQLTSIAALVRRLRQRPQSELHQQVIEAMTTNETSFFRDVAPFTALREKKLPELIAHRAAERRLRIWSGAASSGQEPYSLAMLLLEHFPALATWDVKILATDLSPDILRRGKVGTYSQLEVNRGLPASLLVKYFEPHGADWRVNDAVRRLVHFDEMNLIRPWREMPPMDVVFLRNVLIYFDVPTKRSILEKVRKVMRPDGCLFLGSAETTININARYVREQVGSANCYHLAR